MTGLRRFLHLERARPEPIAEDPGADSRRRIGAVDSTPNELATAQESPPLPSSEAAERFSEPPLRAPDVATPDAAAQPFVRCCRCGSDNTVHVDRCTHCTALLDTPEQRVFNERLWATQRAEAQRLDEEVRRLRESAARAEEEAYLARRKMGEVIAREVGRRERQRLDREAEGDGWGTWGRPGSGPDTLGGGWEDDGARRDRRPVGVRLLYSIQDPGRRLAAIAAVVSAFVFVVALAFLSPRFRELLWVALFVFVVLFAPARRNRWNRWRW